MSATGGSAEVRTARRSGEEYLLERGLFRRKSTGAVVQPAYLEFAFPYYWHYDVLRALDYFRRSGADPDPRMAEAVAVVQSKRQPDGRWLLDRIHPGRVYFDSEGGAGTPSRWNTLCALRVLKWWDESPDDRTIEGKRSPRQSGHDQHDVADDRGVEPGLALVQAELRQGDHELRRDPQHVRLAADFEEFPQLRAAAVHLVSADEIEAGPVGMAAGAEPELRVPAQPYAPARWPTMKRQRPGQQW